MLQNWPSPQLDYNAKYISYFCPSQSLYVPPQHTNQFTTSRQSQEDVTDRSEAPACSELLCSNTQFLGLCTLLSQRGNCLSVFFSAKSFEWFAALFSGTMTQELISSFFWFKRNMSCFSRTGISKNWRGQTWLNIFLLTFSILSLQHLLHWWNCDRCFTWDNTDSCFFQCFSMDK